MNNVFKYILMPFKSKRWRRRALIITCIIAFLTSGILIYQHQKFKDKIYDSAKSELVQLTLDATRQIDSLLRNTMASAENLAQRLSDNRVDGNEIHKELKAMLSSNRNFYGGSITYAPYGYKAETRLYSAYYSKSGAEGALEFIQLADVYDYTTPEYDWYVEPMAKGNRWGEPYWDEAGKTYMITYSALFYAIDSKTNEKRSNGVVTIDISMRQIKNIIESLDIGPSGFGALTTRDGNYLYHPNHEYVQKQFNVRDVAKIKNDTDRLLIAEKASIGEGGVLDHISTTTGEKSWLIFESVPISGWSLQNTFIISDLNVDVDAFRRQIIWIILSVIVFLGTFSAIVLNVDFNFSTRIWAFTGFISFIFILAIAVVWNLVLIYHPVSNGKGVKVSDKATLRTVMLHYQQSSKERYLEEPRYVPTGVYIDGLEFKTANNILVTGRLWQKYNKNFPDKLVKGVQIGRAKSVKFNPLGNYQVDGLEIMQWAFQAELRAPIDYSRYPLEIEHINIQLLPLATNQNVILVPDLDAYPLLTAALLPGLDREVFLPGWELSETYFVLRKTKMHTDFGVKKNFDRENFPTLYYEIGVKRVFIDAFISNLTPLIIALIVLFSVSMLASRVEIGRLMSICVAVFFVVIFTHLDIRRKIGGGEIFYLEYIYFVLYFIIILGPMDAFRLALGMRSKFFEYRDGLLPKLLYWPSILGVFFAITVIKFY